MSDLVVSIKDVRKILQEIDDCKNILEWEFDDGTVHKEECSLEDPCPNCVDRIHGLLCWAIEDEDDNETNSAPSC